MVDEEQHFDQASFATISSLVSTVWDVHCFLDARSAQGLRDPIPYPLDNFDWTGYMPSDDIRSDDSASPFSTPKPIKPEEINMDVMDNWLYSNRGFTRYLSLGTYSDVLESQDKH
uniref:Uncharacterized protein n=1 Tax=Oryza rufipogon TaxID=4529 RepID=A0A0E0RB19_ORYRU